MAINKILINYSKLENLTSPDFGVNETTTNYVDLAISKANEYTNNKLGFGILFFLWAFLYMIFNDKTQLGDFGYSNLQAITLSFAFTSIIGIVLLQFNIIYSFFAVSIFTVLYLIFWIIVYIIENKR